MDISLRTEESRGDTPALNRTRGPGTDEIGIIIDSAQVKRGPYLGKTISTVLLESTGECRFYLDDRLEKL
ncbi:hypothetical protein ACFFKH_15865 [Micromonospora marina]|uniref:Uncharacterized protein n=1 Tax=Micromonospora marina TaxID=307120 RepID=A0A1C5AH75_9ACTN|nr:hypothetical protein [Micromonospora marina]SCF44560.1 hypothetical protein GA0070215_1312 [Micromonospora marina]